MLVLPVNQIQEGLDGSWKPTRWQTKHRFHLWGPVAFAGLEIAFEATDLGDFLRQPQPLFTRPQVIFRAFALGDVLAKGLHAHRLAIPPHGI